MDIKKILKEAHIPHYAQPSLEDTSYVLLSLALGVIKRNVYELVLFNTFSPENEKVLIDKGVKMINGSLSIDSYIKELEKTLKKESNKEFKFDDALINQITMRLQPTIDQTTKKLDLTKETSKSVKKDGTLKKEGYGIVNNKQEDLERSLTSPTEADKKALSEDNTTESRIDPRFLALPEKDRVIVLKAIGELRLPFDGVVTKQVIDKVVQGFKKHYDKQSPQMKYIIDTLLTTLDPNDFKKFTAKDKEVFLNSELRESKITPEELQALEKFARDYDLNINKVKKEWKFSKENYKNVSEYIKQVESNRDFEFLENVIEEANVLNEVKVGYREITLKSYETSQQGIEFQCMINGKIATGYWVPSRGNYVSGGVDVNTLKTEDGTYIKIFNGGGTYRTYEIAADLEPTIKQPKNLQFTGRTLSITNLKKVFIDKIKNALENPDKDPKLSKEFLKYFNIEEANVLEPQSKDYMRITDLIRKGEILDAKGRFKAGVGARQLAQTMANKITDMSKAYRRYKAAEEENFHDLALIFYKRYRDLEKHPVSETVIEETLEYTVGKNSPVHYSSEEKTFVAFSSDLDLSPRDWNSLVKIPKEKEVILTNNKTGKSYTFVYKNWESMDGDKNEVGGWNYETKLEDGTIVKLVIFND